MRHWLATIITICMAAGLAGAEEPAPAPFGLTWGMSAIAVEQLGASLQKNRILPSV